MQKKQDSRKAMLKFAAAMVIFGTIGIFRRFIPLSSSLLACFRGIFGALFLSFIMFLSKKKQISLTPKAAVSFLLTGFAIGLNWMFLFEAYRYTDVGIATLCYYTQPVIVILVSPLIFHEKLNFPKILCVIASVCGMALISSGGPSSADLTGIFYGLAAAVLYASVVILNKKAPPSDPYAKTLIQLFAAGFIMIPYILFKEGLPEISMNLSEWILTAFVCIVHTGFAYLLYFDSLPSLRTQTIAFLGYIDPVSALFLSALILHESLSLSSFSGAVLIILSALFSELF